MQTLNSIGLDEAQTIAAKALAKGAELKLQPLVVAILDARGILKTYVAEDGTSVLRYEIALAKAYGALGMGVGSGALAARAEVNPHFINAVIGLSPKGLVPGRGGVLIRDGGGAIVGAVGISGDVSDKDEACAIAGIEAAGLTADAG